MQGIILSHLRSSSHSIFTYHRHCKNSCLCNIVGSCLDYTAILFLLAHLCHRSTTLEFTPSWYSKLVFSTNIPFQTQNTPLQNCVSSLGSFPYPLTVYPDFDSCYSHFMPYRMTPSIKHRAIEVHYYYYYYYYYHSGSTTICPAFYQLVYNPLSGVFAQKPRYCHITPVLIDLHWLRQRITLKSFSATTAFMVVHYQQPCLNSPGF